jgi:nitrate/nitrite-specific signal transduction histidine kinase
MGVHIMNYRARIVGGNLEITSEPGDGTVVTCTLPHAADGRAGDGDHASEPSAEEQAA